MANPCHKRATWRAVVSGCCPLPQDLLPTFKSACDLGKQESKHTAVSDIPEQPSETTNKTAKLPCETGKTWDFKKVLLEMFREEAF